MFSPVGHSEQRSGILTGSFACQEMEFDSQVVADLSSEIIFGLLSLFLFGRNDDDDDKLKTVRHRSLISGSNRQGQQQQGASDFSAKKMKKPQLHLLGIKDVFESRSTTYLSLMQVS